MPRKQAVRHFAVGERVRVAKKSHVVDHARANENLAEEDRVPLEADVTNFEGEICGQEYESPMKDGGACLPIRLPNDAVLGVPVERLERAGGLKSRGAFGGAGSPNYGASWDRVFGKKKKKSPKKKRA